MSSTITIKKTTLTSDDLIDLIEQKGGEIQLKEEKKKGRPLIYTNKQDYIRMRNKMTKFKNMTLEKAKKQREKCLRQLEDLDEYIKENEPN